VSRNRFLGSEGDRLVAYEAVNGRNPNHNRTSNVTGHDFAGRDVLKKRNGATI
jgi:hypothetical protein